ncbi:hypothetical protein E0Z10_g10965 [Xylaria hypoxylon]|uniref:RNase H type-1 domain-containing protein n=1 Tax=Xylaria hypoxylon TaxID=37992 RepID=A0A4Z0XW92_9PEZI|nr:hypothetical protein E0Z10_g10965 [Xylaria hypoxylon]
MESVLRTAIQAVLLVWKTHPGRILHFKLQIPPAEVLSESIRQRYGFRYGRVDKNHLLVYRLPVKAWKKPTRLQLCYQLLSAFPRPDFSRPLSTKPPQRGNKDEEAKLFREWLGRIDAGHDLIVYSDGAQIRGQDQGVTRTGWGYTIRKGGTTQEVCQGKGSLLQAEVVDAEVYGALMGLVVARVVGRHKRLFVCLDNTSVVDGLNGTPLKTSRNIFKHFKELATTHKPGVIVKWIPGHKNIEGNKAADRLAKDGAMMILDAANSPTST